MNLLFFDCDTSDIWKRELPDDDPAQPWALHIAGELCAEDGSTLDFISLHIRAEGRMVKKAATSIHGVTTRDASKFGVSEVQALTPLVGMINQTNRVIGHSLEMKRKTIRSVLLRRRSKAIAAWDRAGLEWFCCMERSTGLCQIETKLDNDSFKWPSLDEACEILLKEERPPEHLDAWEKLKRMKRVYFELKSLGVVEDD
jgi:hypothetical protein